MYVYLQHTNSYNTNLSMAGSHQTAMSFFGFKKHSSRFVAVKVFADKHLTNVCGVVKLKKKLPNNNNINTNQY